MRTQDSGDRSAPSSHRQVVLGQQFGPSLWISNPSRFPLNVVHYAWKLQCLKAADEQFHSMRGMGGKLAEPPSHYGLCPLSEISFTTYYKQNTSPTSFTWTVPCIPCRYYPLNLYLGKKEDSRHLLNTCCVAPALRELPCQLSSVPHCVNEDTGFRKVKDASEVCTDLSTETQNQNQISRFNDKGTK